jgi:hypothetical protein
VLHLLHYVCNDMKNAKLYKTCHIAPVPLAVHVQYRTAVSAKLHWRVDMAMASYMILLAVHSAVVGINSVTMSMQTGQIGCVLGYCHSQPRLLNYSVAT